MKKEEEYTDYDENEEEYSKPEVSENQEDQWIEW